MNLPELGIRRHVMTYMAVSLVIIFGLVSYFRIGVALFPNIDFPVMTVITSDSGADAEVIDNTLTDPMLEKLNGIPGISSINAQSLEGTSIVNIIFELEKDPDVAFAEVQSKVQEVMRSLPSGVDFPLVLKASTSGEPIVNLTVSGNRTIQQISNYAEDNVKTALEVINGVSEVRVYGVRPSVVRIDIDIRNLSRYNVSVTDIINALNRDHIKVPGGYIVGEKNEVLLNLDLESHTIEDLANLTVVSNNNSVIKLKDLAEVYEGSQALRSFVSYNSLPTVNVAVTAVAGSNAFDIEKDIMAALDEKVYPNLEPGLYVNVVENSVDYIRATISALEEHLTLGVLLTALVVFLFLRNFTSTFIVSVAIPVSLLGSVIVMYAFGYTFNMITMLGLLLLIGVVVDDAIIVLENIYRKLEQGLKPKDAAIEGSGQVAFSVLAATLSLVSIFGPVIFMGGIVGKMFQSFAVVVTFGVIISYIVSLYVTPMLGSRFLKPHRGNYKEGAFKRGLEKGFLFLESKYKVILAFALRVRTLFVILALGLFVSIFYVKNSVEFIPTSDTSSFRINIQTPIGSNVYYTIEKTREVEERIKNFKEIEGYLSLVGTGRTGATNESSIRVSLVDIDQRDVSQEEVVRMVQDATKDIVGAKVFASTPSALGDSDYKVNFSITGPNLAVIREYSDKLNQVFAEDPRIGLMRTSLDLLPQTKVVLDKTKASILGVYSSDVANSLGVSVGGRIIGKFNEANSSNRLDIILQAAEEDFDSSQDLTKVYVKSSTTGNLVRLDNIATVEDYLGYSSIVREGARYSNAFQGNPSVPLGEALGIIMEEADKILPSDYSIELAGASKELESTIKDMLFAFFLGVVLLYMVLASQFNSFVQPLIILVSVPLAIVGSIYALKITGFSINMFSMIGIVLLVGLVAKNAILLIDFTNILLDKGYKINDALMKACPIRLRPILMTSLTVIVTMIPSAFARGEGSENTASLSIVIIGGMLSSTFLTLIVIPVVYSFVEGAKARIRSSIVARKKRKLKLIGRY